MGHYASEMEYDDQYKQLEDLKKAGWTIVPAFLNAQGNYNLRMQYNIKEIRSRFYISKDDSQKLKKDISAWISEA